MQITIRAWCKKDDYVALRCDLYENCKTAFTRAGIELPTFEGKLLHFLQSIVGCFFGFVGADPDAFAAVDTPGGIDHSVSVTDPDGFGGTALEAGRAPFAL